MFIRQYEMNITNYHVDLYMLAKIRTSKCKKTTLKKIIN